MAVYLDCAATTPLDPRVRDEVMRYLDVEFGNAGSRTHGYGRRARAAVEAARDRVAAVVGASRGDVVFTSGATESNNLAILGLAGARPGHVITSRIEHHSVLEPVVELERRGVAVTWIAPEPGGFVEPEAIREALRPETMLVSVMHVNNETGILQPVAEVAEALGDHPAYLHVDAAQGYGKDLAALRHERIDLISVSGHKIHGPKGAGALIMKKRAGERPPLTPLLFGGGQERGLRPGTLPVALIAGLGKAAELALAENGERMARCREYGARLLAGLAPLAPVVHGDAGRMLGNMVNLSIPGLDSETVMEAWEEFVAISNGAACTSQNYRCSHVLTAMRLPEDCQEGALRFSWSATTETPDFAGMLAAVRG